MFQLNLDNARSIAHFAATGDLTIRNAAAFKEAISNAIEQQAQTLELNLDEVERMDLTTLQILCAAHRLLQAQGKSLTLSGTLPTALRETVQLAGFAECGGDKETSGLWMGVTN